MPTQARVPPEETAAWSDPYLCGVALGLVLLGSFVCFERGLGASGAYSSAVAAGVAAMAPEHALANPVHGAFLSTSLGGDWLVLQLLGVLLGAGISARLSGRARWRLVRGASCGHGRRWVCALLGGALMGFGSRWARGCTSGLALSGGAVLSVGGWMFLIIAFAAAHLAFLGLRKVWA